MYIKTHNQAMKYAHCVCRMAANVSINPQDMNLPGLALHQLTGNRSDIWSVFVSGNWLITFRFTSEHPEIVDYEDYH